MQCFGQPEMHPQRHGHAKNGHRYEDPAPVAHHQQHPLPDARRDRRDEQENHENQAHHTRHLVAAHTVADDGWRQGDDPRREESLQRTQHDQLCEAGHQRAGERKGDVEPQRGEQHRAAPVAIGEGSRDEGPDPSCEKVDPDNELPVVALRAERTGEVVERGKDGIDAEGIARHQQRHHANEFALADPSPLGGAGNRAFAAGQGIASHLHNMPRGGQGSALQPARLSKAA